MNELISCLCVTRKRVKYLKRAVECFLRQSYPQRELLVLFESDDPATGDYVHSLNHHMIRPHEVAAQPKKSLGQLRNIAVQESAGVYVTQWDDDDFYDEERIQAQYDCLRQGGKDACILQRWVVYDTQQQQAYISGDVQQIGGGENTLLCRKSLFTDVQLAYADKPQGEDTIVLQALIERDMAAYLDEPGLYIYEITGCNTWDRSHFDDILAYSCTPLKDTLNTAIQQRLGYKA